MAFEWTDRVNFKDYNLAEDVNTLGHELERVGSVASVTDTKLETEKTERMSEDNILRGEITEIREVVESFADPPKKLSTFRAGSEILPLELYYFPVNKGDKLYIINDVGNKSDLPATQSGLIWNLSETIIDGKTYIFDFIEIAHDQSPEYPTQSNGLINVTSVDIEDIAEDISTLKTQVSQNSTDLIQEFEERTQADSLLHSLLTKARIYDYLTAGTWVGSQFVNLPVGTEFVVFNSSYDPLYPNEEVTYTKFSVNDERAYTLSSSIEPNKAYKCKIISQVDVSIGGHNGEIEVIGEFTDSDAYNEINNKLEILSAPINHRNIFRGKNLGSAVTEAQKTAIQSGTFDDLFVGDYWAIDGVNWRIVDMDYWVNAGLPTITKHHLVIMPDTAIATGAMYNAGETTNSGYINSLFCTQTKTETTESIIYSAFPGLILEMNIILSSNVENGIIKGYDVSSKSTHELPSEVMLFGSSLVSPPISPADTGGRGIAEKTQLALFRIAPSFTVVSGTGCWLRDIATETDFVGISALGMMESASCYTKKGFRPVFAIG